jgi:UDPglucose 6-dehydrogenase
LLLSSLVLHGTNISIIGSGYVGLVTGTVLADYGHRVTCVDIDKDKVQSLNKGDIPIYEPGVEDLLRKHVGNNLVFSTDADASIQNAQVIFIAVGTPMDEDGSADMTALNAVVNKISSNINTYKVICTKSTVPIGTNKIIHTKLSYLYDTSLFDVVSNPEFLREGSALHDFIHRNPIVIGSTSDKALHVLKDIYKPLLDKHIPLIATDITSAETIKYTWNCFSAIKIAYINEINELCEKVGASIKDVTKGMSFSDNLLPIKNIIPGPGYGGSCLPKDTEALASIAQKYNSDVLLVRSAIESNRRQKQRNVSKIRKALSSMHHNRSQKTVTLLGLSFKAETDDIRNSPAIEIIHELIKDGVRVKAYDPVACGNMKKLYPDVLYYEDINKSVEDSDLIVVLTEWKDICSYISKNINNINQPVIDTRHVLDRVSHL